MISFTICHSGKWQISYDIIYYLPQWQMRRWWTYISYDIIYYLPQWQMRRRWTYISYDIIYYLPQWQMAVTYFPCDPSFVAWQNV